jgi:hypothetical protein
MKPEEAVINLSRMGYAFEVADGKLRYRYEGPDEPDPHLVVPLLEVVKAHKDEALFFLRCYCPRCGGCCFIPDCEGRDLCVSCDWNLLVDLYPGLKEGPSYDSAQLRKTA